MKRINLLGTALLTIAVMTSCGSSKPVTQTVQQPAVQQDVEINVPCSGPEFQTNKEYFRAFYGYVYCKEKSDDGGPG